MDEMENRLARLPGALLPWYRENRRVLPWREEVSAYRTWVSEIMLQQTRVAAVIPYFQRFMAAYPTVEDLAACDEGELMRLWAGLGYYSRARNLRRAAQVIAEEYGGAFPRTYQQLMALPGWGTTPPGPSCPSPSGSLSRRWTAMCCGWPPGWAAVSWTFWTPETGGSSAAGWRPSCPGRSRGPSTRR